MVGADFLCAVAFFVVAASFSTGVFLEALVYFFTIVAAGLTVFAFVVVARDLGLGAARVVTLPTGFLAVVAFTLVVTPFGAGFLEGGLAF